MLTKKRVMAFMFAFFLTFSFTAGPLAAQPVFRDVGDHPYRQQIDLVTDLGFIFYYEKPYYSPDMVVTRDIAAETMYILSTGTLNAIDDINYDVPIPDVRDSNYPVYYCRDMGIAAGFEDGAFRPNNPVTYGHFIKMLIIALGLDEDQALTYPDDYLSLAELKGITKGLSFNEADLLTNAPAALLVYNCLHIPCFGEDKNQTLLETTFKDMLTTTQSLNRAVADVEAMLDKAVESGTDPDIAAVYGKLDNISGYYSDIYDNNINAAYKYDLMLNKFFELQEVIENLIYLEEELQELSGGDIRSERLEIEYAQEELMELERSFNDSYYGFVDQGYATLLKKLKSRLIELTSQKLELLISSLPTEEDLQKSLEEFEGWMLECLYGEPAEKSKTGVVFESAYDFMQLVDSTYSELYSIYSDLNYENIVVDESYEERMDELYYLIAGSAYMDMIKEYETEGWEESGLSEADSPAQAAQYVVEILQDVEFIHYPEQAKYLIDKLTKEYLKNVN